MPDNVDKLFEIMQAKGAASDRDKFRKVFLTPGNKGYKIRKDIYDGLRADGIIDSPTYEDFRRKLRLGGTPTVNKYRQQMFNSVDPNRSRASELTHRAVGQAVRATNNVRKPVVAKVVNRKGKPTGEKFAITPAKTVEDLDREYAQETTKNWENELHDQMADADKDAAKISDMFKSFIGSTDEVGSVWGNMTRGGGIASTPHSVTTNNGILENTEARQLLAAGDYNRKRRELLQLEQDSRNGAIFDNHSFFRGMYDAAKDTGFLTGGASDLINAGSLLATKQDLDNGVHTEAGDMLMQQAVKNSNAQSQYGDNQGWMYTGGVITTNMAPFMVQIGSAGFSKGMSTSIGKVVQGAASKVALGTMEKATGIAGAHIANYIGKVTGLTTKAFGKAIQYGIVGAAQANTVGLGNVANDVINRYTGQVYQDEHGNYKFGTFDIDGKLVHEGGEDFLTSLVKGEAAQTIEFATELAGGGIDAAGTALKNFITKGGKKIINKYNMENVSKVIDFLLNNKVSKNARYLKAGADRTLGKVEVNSIVGESLEEELGIIANTVFTGDNKISDLWDDKQQSQIWGGMLLSIGLMKGVVAPFHAYNAKQYYSYKHKLDKADVNLSQLLGKEKWEELRNQIDATTNEDMPEMVNKINRDVALGKNRQPVREYIQNLLIMRGYDIGNMLAAKKAVEDKGKGVSVKNMEKNQAYQQGRDAYGYDTHEIQLDQADKQKTLAQLLGITEQQLSTMSDEELDNLSGRDDNLDKAIYDYQLSTIRYQGVADNAQDQVDLAAQKAAQAVDMYTDKSRNTIRNATIKATGGLEDYGVYIINGNIATHDDGSIDVGNSDDMILFYDPTTNTVEHADATRFAELGSEENADEVRNQAVADAKENAIKEITGIIDGVVEVGTQFKTIDADGTEHAYEVLADNGDGTAMITIDGNIPTQLVKGENVNVPVSFEELQKMKDASDQQRLQAAKAQREQMEKERAEQQMQAQTTQAENPAQEDNIQSAPIEDNLDYSDIIREDGKVQMVDVSDKDGNNLFPDAKDVFYIQGNKMRTKFAYIDANGELKTQSFPTGLVKIKTRGEVSVDDYKKYRNMILSAESPAMSESSMIEDNSGTIEADRGGIEVEDNTQPLSEADADNVIDQMESSAEVAPELELTPDNWTAEFGEDGIVSTPIGEVKMGENQVAKLFEKGRSKEFGMIKPTLTNPDVIIEVPSHSADGNEERSSSYLFIKTFLGKNGEKVYYFKSVTIKKDGLEISISSHYDRAKRVKEALMKGKLLYRKNDGAQTEQNQPSASVTTSQEDAAGSYESKDTNISANGNENNESLTFEDGTPIPVDVNGEVDLSQTDAAHAAEWYDTNLGEDADGWLDGEINKAKKVLEQAKNKKLTGTKPSELVASKKEKEAAIADAQAHYDSAISIRDSLKERRIVKEENTADGRNNLIEKARRKYNRLKSAVKDDAEAVSQLYKDVVGSLLHRLYDGTGIDVTDTIPLTAEEYVASNLGAHSLNYEGTETSKGVKQETGLSREDFAKTQLLAADGKGTTIDDLVHSLWENRPSNLDSLDTQDIRNALIGVLTSGFKASEARNYIENLRIAQAENILEEQKKAADNAAFAEEQKAKQEEEEKKAEENAEEKAEEKTHSESFNKIVDLAKNLEKILDNPDNVKEIDKITHEIDELLETLSDEEFKEVSDVLLNIDEDLEYLTADEYERREGVEESKKAKAYNESLQQAIKRIAPYADALKAAVKSGDKKAIAKAQKELTDALLASNLGHGYLSGQLEYAKSARKKDESYSERRALVKPLTDAINAIESALDSALAEAGLEGVHVDFTEGGHGWIYADKGSAWSSRLKALDNDYRNVSQYETQNPISVLPQVTIDNVEKVAGIIKSRIEEGERYNSDEYNDEDEQTKFPDKLKEGSETIEVPEDATEENPLGLQLSEDKVPFEIEGRKSGETYNINDNEDRQRLINDNKVDDKDILDIDMPKHVHKAIKELCKKMGLKVQFLYMGARSNGWIENGTMYLALDTEKATQFVFGHEMTHAIKQKNPEAYKELVKVAMAVTTRKKFEEDLAKVYQNYHGISGYNNVDDFVEEVVADNLGKFINDFDLAQKFSLRLNHPVLATILHAIQEIKHLLYGDFYKPVDALERIVEKAYVDTANGEVTNPETGEDVSFSLRLKSAIEETETNPSDAQKESGNYKKGHIKFGGYDYTIENPKGSTRSGKDADGKEWKVTMHDTYGYIRGKFGKDGDHLDMFINDKADLDNWDGDVFVVDQVNPDGSFDEHKVMYGYDSMDDAKKAYLDNYSDGWQGLGNITGASKDEFDKWLGTSNRKLKPFADYAKVKFSLKDIKPVGIGAFGNIYNQFRGNAKAAIEFLKKVRGGEAVGALHHKDIGDIDLVWGKEGTGHSDVYGLSKLVKYHPEVLDNLQEILNDMRVVSSSKNRVNLESETHKAGVRLTWDGERKSWLLTAFKKETSASDKRTDTAATSLEGDTALSQTEGSAAKIDNSSETAKENGEKFSLKDEKTLAGVHNITEEKLRKALKLGGFANPSLAVIDSNKTGHDNFGEISFIAPSALLDKRTGNTGGTWITDAYTQRYPSVEREMSEKGYRKFEDWVDSLDYPSGAKAEIKRQTKDVLEDNGVPAWELMYLKEKGIDIKAYDSNVDYRWKEIISDHPTAEDILNSMKTDPELNEKVTSLAKHAIIHPTWEKVSLEVRRKMYKETGVKASPINPKVRKQTKEIFERDYAPTLLNKDGSPRKKDVKKVVEDIVKEHNDTKKYDFYLSKVKASNYVNMNGLYDDYIRWQENKLDEFGTKNRIFRGYTKDGSRKYVPETLENVSKVMREEADGQTNGSEYTSFGSFIAKLASRVDSTDEMRANKDKLSSNKDKEEFYEKWSEVYYDLAKFLYNDVFYGEQRLHDIVLQSDPKKYAKKEYGITLTPTFMKKLDALKNAVQTELKSAYFETKYNRPLHLNEFAAAVVPDNLGEDVRKGIENAGLPMYDYDPNKEGDRSRAFNEAINSSDNIRFSLKAEKEKIVADAKANGTYMTAPNGEKTKLDAEQWATVRTTNFKNWFGDWENDPENASKVVDENGEPMVVWHGRSAEFNTFEKKEGVRFIMGLEDKVKAEGFFFSPDKGLAEEFASNSSRHRGGKANVVPCFLNIRRPMDLAGEDYDRIYEDVTGWEYMVGMDTQDNLWGIMDEEGMADKIKEKGYDGAIFVEEVDDSYEPTKISYCALDANQIKSAENNNGDFSADNNDIRFSLAGERGAAAADKAEERTFRMDNLSVARKMEEEKKDAKAIKMATGWERGADGKWRYEMPDAKIKGTMDVGGGHIVKRYEDDMLWNGGKLSDVIDAPELFKAYPHLKDVRIETDAIMNDMPSNGEYNAKTNTITIHADELKYMNSILNHEIQHAIQSIEGFDRGGSPRLVRGEIKKRLAEVTKQIRQLRAEGKEDEAKAIVEKNRGLYNAYQANDDYNSYKSLAGEVEARNVQERMNMSPEERRRTLAESTEDVARKDQIFLGVGDVSFSLRDMADGKESGAADMAEDLKSLNTPDEVDDAIKTAIDDMPSGWQMANKKMIHIAQVLGENRKAEITGEEPKFSLKDGTLIKAGTYFSGGGLVEEGLKGIIDPVVAVEYDEKISGVYRNNFGQHIVTADVRDVDPKELVKQIDGEVEYFHASPVCKNYSQAKSNHAEVELDKETAASTAEFINAVKPKVVTIENVKGYKDSEAMKIITDALDANGYTWDADVYNAADFGGYTNRERLIVRAVRDGKLPAKPEKMAHKSGWYEAVADIIPTLTEKKNGVVNWMDVRLKADGIDWRNIDKPLYVMGSAYADGKIPHAFADELLPTLRTKSGDVIVMPDGKVYRAMGRVLARVSGVSDDYKMPFSENLSHTIIGNGIPTQLTEHVIAPLLQNTLHPTTPEDGNTKFSLRGSTPYDKQMEEWMEKNHLEKGAVPMEKPIMKEGENIFDYANRMVEWTRNQNLWKTAPKKTGFQDALDKWKADNGLSPDAYPPVRPHRENYSTEIGYAEDLEEYNKKKELWKSAPKPKDFDLSVDLEDMNKQLRNIRRAVLNQKNYDQRTVKAVSDLVRKMLNIGWGDGLSRGKVGNLLSAAKNATGANDVKKYLDKAMGILAENYLNRLSTAYDNLINTRGARADQSGVIKMGSLDAKGQAFMSEYKKAINMDDSSLNTYIANIEEDSAKNEDNVEMNDYRLAGIQAAIMYKQQIGGNDADIAELKRQIGELKNKKDATKEDKDLLKSLEKKLFENKFDRITMYENLLNNIQRMVKESKGRAKEFREEIAEHKNEILHRANLDLEGVDSTYYDTTTAKKKFVNNDLQRAVFSSTYTFEQFLKFFGKHSANGEGRLYNYFHKLNQDALDEEQLYNEMNRNALDEKTKELFGKEKFMKLVGIDGNSMNEMDVEVTDYSNKETGKRTIHLKQGQMLYIYLVNKETDGEMKLRAMGITEGDVAAIEENLDPRVKAMGEWLQDEYLPECQRRYQATHTKYFGAPMKEVENYFPLAINNRARNVKEDVNQDSDAMSQLAGTSTGAIVTRRVNVIPLDIENADAFEVAFNHLQEMEEWSAMLPFRQDINTLLSYTHFRNQVQNMSSVAYGSGKTLWDEFKQTAQIAAGTYKPKVNAGMMDSRIAAAMGGIAVAKISGRLWTAIKQSQSATVFLPECDFTRFVKNGVNPYGSWKWAMENIPDFRKRVENMTYGDVKLRQYLDELEKWHDWTKTISKIGMAPNILVDGITCAVGARSVYETEVNRLTKLGYPKEKAEEKAYYKAVAAYNKTQQSSGGMYLSPMQVDRTYVSAALSLFKNANYAYGRMQIEACRGLARTYDLWGGKHKTTLIESMTRQIMEEDGLDENTARAIAKATYSRTFRQSIGRLINFATLVPVSWALYKVLPYLLTGDDDDKKKEMIEEAVLKGFATSLSDNYVIPFASNILNAGLKVEDGKPTFDPEVFRYQNLYINPATSDLANIYSMIGNQKWYSVANKLGMLGVQSLIGFNPETVGALYQAFAEADYDNGNAAKEWKIGILKAISAPEESIRELYMDELGLKSGDIKKIPLAELEKRYAERQINRDNLLSQIGMDAETFNGYVEKYQKSFEKKIKDKMDKWDEYDKKKADEFFDTTSDPKLKDMIAKKRANDANAAADEQIAKEGLNQEKKGKEPSEVAYDAVKMSIDVAEDNAISTYNKVLNKRYAALNDEYNNQTDAMKYIFMSKHPNFKAYKDLESEYTTYGKKLKELKEKLVSADGYDAKQTILKQIRAERDKFYELQSKVR